MEKHYLYLYRCNGPSYLLRKNTSRYTITTSDYGESISAGMSVLPLGRGESLPGGFCAEISRITHGREAFAAKAPIVGDVETVITDVQSELSVDSLYLD